MKYTEKHYILLLISNRKHYLAELPPDVIEEMGDYFKMFHTILNFHHYQFYPALKKTGVDMLAITNVFKSGIQQNVFDIYYKYAMICGRVEAVLQDHFKGNHKEVIGLESEQSENDNAKSFYINRTTAAAPCTNQLTPLWPNR
jgi:hypothetical protein